MASWKVSASTIATATAAAAIALGIIDSMQTRAHNRLSVAPYLVVDYSMAARPKESSYAVDVSNEGVGPAIIEGMRITLPPSLGGGSFDNWNAVVDVLRKRGAQVPSYWNYAGGEALGVQRTRQLLMVVVGADSAPQLMKELADINVEITYRSIYRQKNTARLK